MFLSIDFEYFSWKNSVIVDIIAYVKLANVNFAKIKEIKMIVDEIKKANIEAIKSKDTTARALYSVLLNKIKLEEINKRSSNGLSDGDVAAILQKAGKELAEERDNYIKAGNQEMAQNISKQIELVNKYMPKMLSDEEIKNIINSLEDKSLPFVMKYFKQNYQGACDMKKVGEILKGMQ